MYDNYINKKDASDRKLRELEERNRRSNLWTKIKYDIVTALAMIGAGTLLVGLSVGVLTLLGVYG